MVDHALISLGEDVMSVASHDDNSIALYFGQERES